MTNALATPLSSTAPGVPVLTTTRWLFGRLRTIFLWTVGMVVLVAGVIAPVTLGRFMSEIDFSVWELFAANAPAWFLFSLGITCTQYMPVLLAQGVTRTHHARATVIALAGTALMVVAFLLVGYAVEPLIYERIGLTPAMKGPHLFTTLSQVHLVVAEYWTFGMMFALVGMLTGYSYLRLHGLVATLLLPITTIAPLGLGLVLMAADFGALVTTWGWGLNSVTPTGIGLLALMVVTLALLCTWVPRFIPIRTKPV